MLSKAATSISASWGIPPERTVSQIGVGQSPPPSAGWASPPPPVRFESAAEWGLVASAICDPKTGGVRQSAV